MADHEENIKRITDVVINTIFGVIINITVLYVINKFLYTKDEEIPTRKIVEMGIWTFLLGSFVWAVYHKYRPPSRIDMTPGLT